MKTGIIFIGLLLVMGGASAAFACECDRNGPPCESYFESDSVFVGTVRTISPEPQSSRRLVRVAFENIEGPDGRSLPALSVLTSDTEAECGYPFRAGERYVVYANRQAGRTDLHVTLCSRTQQLSTAKADVEFFQTLSQASQGSRVYGTISRSPADAASATEPAPIAGASVTLRGPEGTFGTKTAGDGRFDIRAIPPGKYELTVVDAPGSTTGTMQRSLELRHPHACVAADFAFPPDARR